MKSVWQETELPHFPRQTEDLHTDVLIIGGGLAGILTAYFLEQNGVDYVLAEKDRICGGQTQNTTAKITLQHGLIYGDMADSSLEKAKKYYKANEAAVQKYASMCKNIDCDWEPKDNYVYSVCDREKLEKEVRALGEIGCKAELCDSLPLPMRTAGAVKVPLQAQFHPLKFVRRIAKGLHIYEHTQVLSMAGKTAMTNGGRIFAKRVICATHFPLDNKHGSYFMKMYQHRSYVIALENAPYMEGMFVDAQDTGLSFRYQNGLLLLGGGGSRTGKPNGNWRELRAFAERKCPDAREKYHWAAQDCMTLDSIPYIGQYSKRTPGFYVATGFNKWGMTGSMVAATLLCDRILGKPNDVADVFDPSRSMLKPQLLQNTYETLVHFDPFAQKVCPHLGCALQWNRAEHSWDCPCHGSRFAQDGTLLDNPANGDL